MKIKTFLSSLLIVFLTAALGSIFTSQRVAGEWYESIKPDITPPNYVFPIVWNILFLMIATSLYFAWINASKEQKKKVAFVFGVNLTLNVLWSVFYFGLMNPLAAFIELIFFWISIVVLIFVVSKISKLSAYLLIPYLLWVSFAGILNYLSI